METKADVCISAIICTYRNPHYLKGAIRSLLNQTLPANQYEIIVVDNNSQDETPEIVHQLSTETDLIVRYVKETRRGLSNARNSGIEAAQGEIVAFLDDDAEAESNWLSNLFDVYKEPNIWAAGGKLLPLWHIDERPDWLTEEYVTWLSLLDQGDQSRPLTWPERILGANFSFRKSIFPIVGYFDPTLGRKGTALLGHEDTELQQRIHKNGKLVYYVANAIVYHHVPAERVTERYFLRRQYGASRSQVALLLKQQGFLPTLRQVLRQVIVLAKRSLMIIQLILFRKRPIPFNHKRMFYAHLGQIVGFLESLLNLSKL